MKLELQNPRTFLAHWYDTFSATSRQITAEQDAAHNPSEFETAPSFPCLSQIL